MLLQLLLASGALLPAALASRSTEFSWGGFSGLTCASKCVVQMQPGERPDVVGIENYTCLRRPDFYQYSCFPPYVPNCSTSLTQEKVDSVFWALNNNSNVVRAFPESSLTIMPLTALEKPRSYLYNKTAGENESCHDPFFANAWYILAEATVPRKSDDTLEDKNGSAIVDGVVNTTDVSHKRIELKKVNMTIQEAWAKGYTGEGVRFHYIGPPVDCGSEDLSGRVSVVQGTGAYSSSCSTDSVQSSLDSGPGTAFANILMGDACNSFGTRGVSPDATMTQYYLQDDEVGFSFLLNSVGCYYGNETNLSQCAETVDNTIVVNNWQLDSCNGEHCYIIPGNAYFDALLGAPPGFESWNSSIVPPGSGNITIPDTNSTTNSTNSTNSTETGGSTNSTNPSNTTEPDVPDVPDIPDIPDVPGDDNSTAGNSTTGNSTAGNSTSQENTTLNSSRLLASRRNARAAASTKSPRASKPLKASSNDVVIPNGTYRNIFLYSAGTGGESGASANMQPQLRGLDSIVVGSVGPDGERADFSAPGSNIMFSAPSNGTVNDEKNELGLLATTSQSVCAEGLGFTLEGNCITSVQSAGGSLAVGAGVVGLVLQALRKHADNYYNGNSWTTNSSCTWVRDPRVLTEILAASSQRWNDHKQFDGKDGWTLNNNGYFFSNNYGFGLVNASWAVDLASNSSFDGIPARSSFVYNQAELDIRKDPDAKKSERVKTFYFYVPENENVRVERVFLGLDLETQYMGDLQVRLISPGGTGSVLIAPHDHDSDSRLYLNTPLASNAFHGETSAGAWAVEISSPGVSGRSDDANKNYFVVHAGRLSISGSKQLTCLTAPDRNITVDIDDTIRLAWRTSDQFANSSFAQQVDFWITNRLHEPIARIAENVSYNAFEYKWDAHRVPLKHKSYGFFLMVPAGTSPTSESWDPHNVYSNIVRFEIEGDGTAKGAFVRPPMIQFMAGFYLLAVSLAVLLK